MKVTAHREGSTGNDQGRPNSRAGSGHRAGRRRFGVAALAAAVAAVGGAVVPAAAAAPAVSATPSTAVTAQHAAVTRAASTAISFTVQNVNRSKVACAADGKTYTVRGHLVAPAGHLTGGATRAATLYLHGLGFGEFFWDFDAVAGYNYAADQARAGQVSVVVDRLGYGASGKPNGNLICVGSRADIAHQVVQDLRSGHYTLGGRAAVKFGRVVLAGHSYGAQISQVEAYSFGDINGLILVGYADRVQSTAAALSLVYANITCSEGGQRVTPGGARHYTSFGPPVNAPAALFNDTAPAVLRVAVPELSIDPCGDDASFARAVTVDLKNVSRIKVPVLIVEGGADAFFPQPAATNQAALFTGARSVSTAVVLDAGHAITLERHHVVLENAVLRFLRSKVTSKR